MNRLYSIIILILFFTNTLISNTITTDRNSIKLLNIINQQGMLSQQITKAYLYAGKGIAIDKANREIKNSLKEFKNSYQKVNHLTKDKRVKNIMRFVKQSSTQFSNISNKPLNTKNVKTMLNLSESILNKSEQIISSLKKEIHNKDSEFIATVGEQSILAQKIAKYYIAYQLNKSRQTKSDMKKSIEMFQRNRKKLTRYRTKNPTIKKKLDDIDELWKITHTFYADIERGELPLIVFDTTDKITNTMNELIRFYTSQNR
ncbi:MAG: hypothetical protein GXO60_06925 [Epsilonproteobacteria bacterium]|nr:hypothetical protein [Campylobacterota bacterium]